MKITKKITGPLLALYLLFVDWAWPWHRNRRRPQSARVFREFVKPGKSGSCTRKARAPCASDGASEMADALPGGDCHHRKPRVLFLTDTIRLQPGKRTCWRPRPMRLFPLLWTKHGGRRRTPERHRYHRLVYSEQYSLRSAVDIPHMRYFEISLYR